MSLPTFIRLSASDKARALSEGPPMAGPPRGGPAFIGLGKASNTRNTFFPACDICGRNDRLIQSIGHDRMACYACVLATEEDA